MHLLNALQTGRYRLSYGADGEAIGQEEVLEEVVAVDDSCMKQCAILNIVLVYCVPAILSAKNIP